MLAKSNDREPKEISEEEVAQRFKEADTDHNNELSKVELMKWITKYIKNDATIIAETKVLIDKVSTPLPKNLDAEK